MSDSNILQEVIDDARSLSLHFDGVGNFIITLDELVQIAALRDRRKDGHIQALEGLRPLWAMGYSSDSVAAQITSAALAQIWEVLGVDNQTDCMAKLKELAASTPPKENEL